MSANRKAQVFTTDFVASAIIFLIIMNLAILTWNLSYKNQIFLDDERTMRNSVVRSTDLLIRTSGHPSDWNVSTVKLIGLTPQDHLLDSDKAGWMSEMTYKDQKKAIRSTPHEFYLEITLDGDIANITASHASLGDTPIAYMAQEGATISQPEVLTALNSSDLEWDLYWPSNMDEDQLPSLTAESVYNYTTDSADMFDDMVDNATGGSYETLIAENLSLSTSDISNENLLQQFVEDDGGSYIHLGKDPQLIQNTFSLDSFGSSSTSAQVEQPSPLINSSHDIDDSITLQHSPMSFDNVSSIILQDQNSPNGCLGCKWYLDSGELHYLASASTTANTLVFTDADSAFSNSLNLAFGRDHEGADTIVVHERNLLIPKNGSLDRAQLKLVFWQ